VALILKEEADEAVCFSLLIVGSFSSACLNITVPAPPRGIPPTTDRKSRTIYYYHAGETDDSFR
jgi:hypothetical protein